MAARRERLTFIGSQGEELSGRVELPAGPIRATAVFAHCFTCSSDSAAAARISVALAEAGIAVLRFDFTGLGRSDGDFADTNFTSNIADLVAAATELGERYRAPGLLIGHSLGGAAVLAAASRIASVRAVVTIGAPSEPDHVEALLADGVDQVEADGEATINIGGRPFRIKRQLLADLRERTLDDSLAELDAGLLVMHSPTDNTVGIDNAAAIYAAARHPKSFISLDGADHLLTNRADAAFVASMIRTWVERYLEPEAEPDVTAATDAVVVAETGAGGFINQVVTGRHRFVMDEPTSVGGEDAGPNPYDLLGAALGGCTSMTIRMYAERKKIPLERVEVEVRHGKTHCADCEKTASGATPKIDQWERRLRFTGADLTDEHVAALTRIADRCPVHLTLERSSVVVTEVAG
ncbi:MAG: alpha/beta fold hydrolase [Nocardioides sp.]